MSTRRIWTREVAIDLLHVFVLFGFTIVQPLFALVSSVNGYGLFLRARSGTVLLLVFFLCVVLPAMAAGLELLAALHSERLRRGVHAVLVALLFALFSLPLLRRLTDFRSWMGLAGAAIAGIAAATLYMRVKAIRSYVTFLAPTLLIFPALFLGSNLIRKVVFLKGKEPVAVSGVRATTPLVLVVFDELPISSLMDEQRRIDPVLYPHFAALAQDATWYRNATAAADFTVHAVPGLLSGIYPTRKSLPTYVDFPRNIFTLLGRTHEMHVHETYTYLCPDSLCRGALRRLKQGTHIDQLQPLANLYLDVLLPFGARSHLERLVPAVRSLKPEDPSEEHLQAFDEFLKTVEPTAANGFYFVHLNLPHFPWVLLPSGKRYVEPEWHAGFTSGLRWPDDEDVVLRAYQRHLLQVGYVDRMLGRLLDRLHESGLYDRSLLVVTADHGVSFRAGGRMRDLTPENSQDVLPVPMFIKAPEQRTGEVRDFPVATVDLLPTIAEMLGVSVPWPVDGKSFAGARTQRPGRRTYPDKMEYDPARMAEAVLRKCRLFGRGKGIERLWKIGPDAELIGRSASEVGLTKGSSKVEIEILDRWRYENVRPEDPILPALVAGRLSSVPDAADTVEVAVAVNGVLEAVSQVEIDDRSEGRFAVLVPERALRPGRNDVEAFVVETGVTGLHLAHAATPD